METTLVNLTLHTITLLNEAGEIVLVIKASGAVARCEMTKVQLPDLAVGGAKIALFVAHYGDIVGLPEPQPYTYYITSRIVASAAIELGRCDVVSPGELARDERGVVVGCMGLCL